MAATRITFPEFRDQFEQTKYPFSDFASLLTTDGSQAIEQDTFLDACLHPIGGGSGLSLTYVNVASRTITLYVGDPRNKRRASCSFDPLDPPDTLLLHDIHDRPAGIMVSAAVKLARFSAWAPKEHEFRAGAAEFVASCVIPTPETGVRGLLTDLNELVTGDVWLIGDHGVVLREVDGRIRVDIVGDPLYARRLCADSEQFTPPLFIQSVNECPPDEFGNYQIIVGAHLNLQTVLRIYPAEDGLHIAAVGGQRG